MDAQTVAINMLISVTTGVITGVFVGIFGIRSAVKQFKLQRAFERQLEWYENTTQAVIHFRELNETLAFALENNRVDLLEFARDNTFNLTKEFQNNVNNSLLYADRKMYLRLKEYGAKLKETAEAVSELLRAGKQPTGVYQSNVKLLEKTAFELAKPIRKMLGLNGLSLGDFQK
jgi:hypothetical protein